MSKAAEHRGLSDESADLVQAQYEASGTIYGSSEPGEILEAFISFAGAAFSTGHLALLESDQTTLRVMAEADQQGVRAAHHYRQLDQYPAYDTLSAVEVLSIEDVPTDAFLTEGERERLAEQNVRSIHIVPLVIGQRLIGLIVFTHTDVSSLSAARLRALRSLADQAAVVFENQSLLRSTESTLEEVRTLYDINRAMLGAQDIPAVLRLLREHLVPHSTAILHLVFQKTSDGRPQWMLRHRLSAAQEQVTYTPLNLPENLIAAEDAQVVFVETLDAGPTHPLDQFLREHGAASYARLAIGETGHFDVIAVLFDQPSVFDSRTRRLYSAVADQVAIVLQNQQLLRDTQSNTLQLTRQVRVLQAVNRLATGLGSFSDEKTLLDFTIHEMTTSLDADHGGLMMFDPEINYGTVASEYPSHGSEGVRLEMRGNALFEALKEDPTRPFIVYDVEHDARVTPETLQVFRSLGIQSMMMVPVMMEGKLIASVGLDLYTRERQFTPEMIEIGQTMGAQLSGGLLNLRLLSDAQRRADQLQRIALFSQSVQVTMEIEKLLQIMLSESRQMLALDRMSISLHDPLRNEVRTVAEYDNGDIRIELANGDPLSLEDTLAGDVWKTQQAIYIGDLEDTPHMQRTQRAGVRSIMIAPIWSRGRVTGLIEVGSQRLHPYSDTDAALFQQMITQFAAALENSEAYAQSQRAAKNQALVSDITAQLQQHSDIQEMVEAAIETLGKALGARRARVRLNAQADDHPLIGAG
jgi:GAF domain-containing protein